jgi:hypothetical protein
MSLSSFQSDKCLKIVDKLIDWKVCEPFIEMVDPVRARAPDYPKIVTHPMSLNEVKTRIRSKRYKDIAEFRHDMNLIWDNAQLYNGDDNYFTYCAKEASLWFNKKMKHFPGTLEEEWMRKMQKVMGAFYHAIKHPPGDVISKELPNVPSPLGLQEKGGEHREGQGDEDEEETVVRSQESENSISPEPETFDE